MIKIITVIGARPQIIKASAVSRAIRRHFSLYIQEVIVHTGQHYDENMSEVFFRQLDVPEPDYNLEVGSGLHGLQTARMIEGLERVMLQEQPHYVILYGDTNSTLAGAVAASKLKIPIAHVEAGLRSFNKSMPEEINRILCDHVSSLLFSPTLTGVNNLEREGFSLENKGMASADHPKIHHCGDVMYDNSLYFSGMAEKQSNVMEENDLEAGQYVLATIHRDHNTDDPVRLDNIFRSLLSITAGYGLPVIAPLHPRTAAILEKNLKPETYEEVKRSLLVRLIPPASFFDMMTLEKHCLMVMTDSGGVQKEAWFNQKPCLILRPETEWLEITAAGAGMVTDTDPDRIIRAFDHYLQNPPAAFPPVFGDGKAAEFICKEIMNNCE
ncbi:MAG TPA: UDP-N-acetylglucosamine 2-epimerase (non-hydrolyzing) [Bacteroidales bacterium]|nr:UDP-N-acetylglucosamine 2-epimerase (non-hydrolyzing) [Bacteroidales bacterium]HSA43149.1 UDP-N-acetylglucosamine 2-epimerase (non-hydrolyzing) [Bacteroidales bacterium]